MKKNILLTREAQERLLTCRPGDILVINGETQRVSKVKLTVLKDNEILGSIDLENEKINLYIDEGKINLMRLIHPGVFGFRTTIGWPIHLESIKLNEIKLHT